jgi:hypothetical protein
MNIEGPSDLLDWRAFGEEPPRELSLLSLEFAGPSESYATTFGRHPAGLRPFPNKLAFKLRDPCKHGHNHLASG